MSATGYFNQSVTVGSISDKLLQKPQGSGTIQITPTIPAAIAQTSADTLPSPAAPFYTKSSSTVLHLTLPGAPGFTTGSLMGIFWTDGTTPRFCIDCVITSITGSVVVITAPGSIPDGQDDFTTITAGTTEVTFSVANLTTADQPGNTDETDYTIAAGSVLQLLMTCAQTGAFELFVDGDSVLVWNYATMGDFYSWITGETAPWVGTVNKIRYYSSAMQSQVMAIGALMA